MARTVPAGVGRGSDFFSPLSAAPAGPPAGGSPAAPRVTTAPTSTAAQARPRWSLPITADPPGRGGVGTGAEEDYTTRVVGAGRVNPAPEGAPAGTSLPDL